LNENSLNSLQEDEITSTSAGGHSIPAAVEAGERSSVPPAAEAGESTLTQLSSFPFSENMYVTSFLVSWSWSLHRRG
jgi:hypothetical protein